MNVASHPMTQTNVSTGATRMIRRATPGQSASTAIDIC
jgi:hypothetical protein